ncbi:D-sedoheptulose-7-phosphate isomerase [Prevotella nigrescens]|uniref:D-sedoheptulose-7-phosphate isomerase n=1 Tax=Prevotella nigrescens TaxID=28133 RepID=UPI0002183189|nr:SIS domain-containing protein [Prevotella nigrescens]EGQ17112.1 phosphoheptose isomerase [Prevotella nigrescens ATCC 33563]UAK27666.1 SIS domain-containing protein [Prevotella nigrescens]WMS21596.1 SIS domain-containing protein [Prevotella nigrescens]SUB92243.1 Phosphoheptose isomerase [Prevotella nigrescens]
MSEKQYKYINSLLGSYPKLNVCKNDIIQAYEILRKCYSQHHKLLICGNGGSAADSEHIVGELMKGFTLPRKLPAELSKKFTQVDNDLGNVLAENLQGALPSIALTTHTALSTAFMNDCQPVLVFAQQVYGYAQKDDCFLGISTSGNSQNVLYAAVVAKAQGMSLIGLTGAQQNKLEKYCDVCIHVPETETYKIQELHLPIYHCICLMLEEYFFGK